MEDRRICGEHGSLWRGGGYSRRKRESPRVFGPCFPSSFVPELRLFSWPSFSRFVHPWAQSRARERAKEKEEGSERERERVTMREPGGGRRMKYDGREEG